LPRHRRTNVAAGSGDERPEGNAMARFFALLVAIFCCGGSAVAAPALVSSRAAPAFRAGHKLPKCQAPARGSGLLYDGDFQLMPDIGSNYSEYFAGEPFAPGWHVSKGSVDFNGSTGWGPPAPNNGLRARAFATTPNAPYVVTFLFSGNGGENPQVKKMDVEAAGQSQEFSWDLSQGDAESGNYVVESWTFTATASATNLRFVSRDARGSSRGPVIGDISVTLQ
jgi:hypothetical protein